MSKSESPKDPETEAALLDAELFLKYAAPERAIKRLRDAVTKAPRSIQLHERLRGDSLSRRNSWKRPRVIV